MNKPATLFYPYDRDWLDVSQIAIGNPDRTDFISWLLTHVGVENYRIITVADLNGVVQGWFIEFVDSKQAMAFKLIWL